MPSKEYYRELVAYAEQKLTISVSEWTSFLATASRLYKYPYHEQVMIHAQRPNATACAEYDVWNKKMGRFIRKGAKGIALLDDTQGKTKLRYVFDVSDTVVINEKSKTPWIWELEDKHIGPVMAMLERTYGVGGSEFEQIEGIARKLADEYWADHQEEILHIVDDSLLEEYDEFNIGVRFKTAATVSTAYSIMLRCGLEPEEYFDHQDFSSIFDFDTKQTIGALGTAVSQINQQVLRQIADKIRQADREAIQERRALYERDQIHPGGRSTASRLVSDRYGADTIRQIRADETIIPSGTSAHHLQPHVAGREIISSSEGDRQNSDRETGADDAPAGQGGWGHRGAESQRPDEVGGPDEHLQGPGRGDSEGGADLRLISAIGSEEEADSGKLPASSDVDKRLTVQESQQISFFPSPELSQQVIDEALCIGANDQHSRLIICAYFKMDKPLEDNTRFLEEHYGENGAGFYLDGEKYAIWYNAEGIHVAEGESAQRTAATLITWEQAAKRIRELLDLGRYMPQSELDRVDDYEVHQLANRLLLMFRDIEDAGKRFFPSLHTIYDRPSGFPEAMEKIAELLGQQDGLQTILSEYEVFAAAYKNNPDILRFPFYRPLKLQEQLTDLQREPLHFTAAEGYVPQRRFFISDDEIDNLLRGGKGGTKYRLAVYSFYREHSDRKEREHFLKHYHGEYSGYSGGNDDVTYQLSKGVRFSHGTIAAPYATVELKWREVEKRVGAMIEENRFLTEADWRAIPPDISQAQSDSAVFEQYGEDAKEAEPELRAVGRIEYLGTNGQPGEIVEFSNIENFLQNIREDTLYGVPFSVVLYRDHHGNTIPTDFLAELDPPPKGFRVEDAPTPMEELEQEQVEKILADETAAAAAPTIRELHEQYKPIVLEAVTQDNAYRNACGHSDYENAVIEGNAAIRRAVLGSGNMGLLRLYSDTPEFRQRLHREVIDETYPRLHEMMRPISQGDIDDAICAWNGDIQSKYAVVRYMEEHGREKQTAAWLAHEYSGKDSESLFVTRAGSPEEIGLPWPKVQRRIAQLIREGRFLTDQERQSEPQSQEKRLYQVIVYHQIENGFDEKKEYQTLEEAEKAAKSYVDGTMEPDGFSYDGAAVYDLDARQYLRIYGDYPDEKAHEQLNVNEAQSVDGPIEQAKELINQFCQEEYDSNADFSDLEKVGIAYTTVTDEEIPIQVNVDLVNYRVERYLDGQFLECRQYSSLEMLIKNELEDLSFDELVYVSEDELASVRSALPEVTEEELDEYPISVEINGQWHTFPNVAAAEAYEDNLQSKSQNFRITDDNLGTGGSKEKFWRNIKAIATLKQIEQEHRNATPEEQHLLSQYVGWGGLADAFDPEKPAWATEYAQLKELLTPEEYAAARGSTINAHYTSPVVIRAMYDAVGRMGFETGNILEPSCGVGNFFGMLPERMAGSKLYGVELDSISGRIAQQLYPRAEITVAGFETTDRRDFYDLAIGNVPFGQYQVNDKAYNKLHFNIHNYFFAKALDQVRPGGVVAFVTSRYTMDAKDSTVRRYLAQRAELLGAIRLPNDAFKKNAGAEVVSDIIFLQKRDRPLDIVPEWTQTGQTEDGFAINRYFLDHPEMVLGRQEPESTAHGMDYTVNPIEGLELANQLHDAVKYIRGTYQDAELPELGEGEAIDTSIPADPNVKNYSYTVVDGDVYYRENSRMVRPELNATAEARVKGLVGLRECVQQLIDLQMDAATPDSAIQDKQAELNRLYDSFSAKYGLINARANRLAFADDSSYYLLCALEVIDEDGKLERKADMFTKRTIKPHKAVDTVDTASEALAVSIAEKARVDMEYMEQLTGKTSDELAAELQGVIFRLPGPMPEGERPTYVTADEYLSGNVRRKLRQAQRAAQQDPAFSINVEALTAAQPKDLDASEIEVRLGATWIDKKYIQQFMYETFNTPNNIRYGIKVNYTPFTAEWQISKKGLVSDTDVAAYTTYGTSRANAYKILEDSLNLRDVRIYDTVEDADGRERRVLNAKETTLAAQKQQAIRDAFRDWIWRDPERRQTLVHQYNEEMNAIRPREYDGSHITFGGMNPTITLRDHQLGAIAHILYGGNTLLAHVVGAGKTFEMIAAAMESKRLGLCQKSLFVVPNHLTEQWATEYLYLYPSAKILVTTKRDFEAHNRKKFCARIATGDYDAVIIAHSQFEKIPISRERQERLIQEQIDEITNGIVEVMSNGGERFTVKQLERTKKSLEARLEKLQAEDRKDDVVTFEQLGVDRLFVDEAQDYKNLFLYTKMRNVAGLSTSDAQKSSDMFAKCRYMDEITGNRGVIFATGTPIDNSMTELYTMQRYLQYKRLQELNMTHFDSWASRFGETVTALELAPEGTGYRVRTRFSKFFNLPELMNLFREVADIKTADQLHLPTPEVEYHTVVAKPTEHQKAMVKALSERASKIHSGSVDPSQDNMLKITSDGRKLGLDQRIINPMLPDESGTKVNQCVATIVQTWRDGGDDKLTQLVFCDISTPKAAPSKKEVNPETVFTVYEDIRQKLIAQGMPSEQIAFIHEANTEARKKELFSKVRTGQVRVLLGSTAKMGAGTNVQDRLIALHDLDCPWRPGDLEQRKGRIERQGNQNPLVHVYRYVTEGTFDAYLWQTVEKKQNFISQIMTSKSPVRSCEDLDETALSFAEIKALCAGDPRIKERMDLDVEVSKLRMMKADHQSKQYRLEDRLLRYFPEEIEKHKGFIQGFEADLETLAAHPHPEDGFAGMEIRGDTLTDRENAGAALLDASNEVKGVESVQIGSYRGFSMSVLFDAWRREYTLLLRGRMTHRVSLGTDPRGNIIRIDNALAQMPQRLAATKVELDNLYQQQAATKEEVGKPFPYEDDLRTKAARLIELDTLLNLGDSKGRSQSEPVVPKNVRPSVLNNLKYSVPQQSSEKKLKRHGEVR